MRFQFVLVIGAILLGGCDSTVTRPQLLAQARHLRASTPQGQMLHVGSDDKYEYYRFEPGGQRYKVPHAPGLLPGPTSRMSAACGSPDHPAPII